MIIYGMDDYTNQLGTIRIYNGCVCTMSGQLAPDGKTFIPDAAARVFTRTSDGQVLTETITWLGVQYKRTNTYANGVLGGAQLTVGALLKL